jgi:hypothetical protein
MWFAQTEVQFSLAGISSKATKFFHVISQLDHRYATKVEDIIISPPERDTCTTLRAELMRRLTLLEWPTNPPAAYDRGDGQS